MNGCIFFEKQHAICELERRFQNLSVKKVFLVCGKHSFSASGAEALLQPLLNQCDVVRFSDIKSNPHINDIKNGIKSLRSFSPDLFLAVGGGSIIDTAKAINALCTAENPEQAVIKNQAAPVYPLFAIPTTAGTGSEATHFAVVYVDGKKYSLAHAKMQANFACVVPDLTMSMPYSAALPVALDAMAQSIEAFWSCHSTEQSDFYAKKALHLILPALPLLKERCYSAMRNISEGAFYAGSAINIAKTTAPHAFSYALTSKLGLPHGHAVAFWLPFFASFNENVNENNCNDKRGVFHVQKKIAELRNIFKLSPEIPFHTFLTEYITSLGLNISTQDLKITREIFKSLLKDVNLERLGNNPVKLSEQFSEIATSHFFL